MFTLIHLPTSSPGQTHYTSLSSFNSSRFFAPCPCYAYFHKTLVFDPIEGLLLELGGSSDLSLQSERLGPKARSIKLDKYHTISSCFVHVRMVSPAATGNGCCRLRVCRQCFVRRPRLDSIFAFHRSTLVGGYSPSRLQVFIS